MNSTPAKAFCVVRPALEKDEESVFALAAQLSAKFTVERAVFAASFAVLIRTEDVYLRVVEEKGRVIAYLLGWSRLAFYANGPVAWVQEIVVDPPHRRGGVGKQLMTDFESWAAKSGCRLISLATRGASDFYQTLGYRESATYYKKPIQPDDASRPDAQDLR